MKPQPKKSLGQNFLTDHNILRKEAGLLDPKHKTVFEIGAGDGRLSEKILELEPKRLFLVEKDKHFADLLNKRFAGYIDGGVVVVLYGDALEIDFPEADLIIGNIPYYITSQIIFKLAKTNCERIVLIVQKEFAEKMIAKANTKRYGRLSITAQLAFDIEFVQVVPRHLFKPMPKVDSALIILKPTNKQLTEHEEKVIRWLFSHKNKTVRNALLDSGVEKEKIAKLGEIAKRKVRALGKEEVLKTAQKLPQT